MQKDKVIDWIQLINSEGIGSVTFFKMLKKYGSAQACLQQPEISKKAWPRKKAELEFEKAQRLNVQILLSEDEAYPQIFKQLYDTPPVIYARGQISLLNYPSAISIVGSRSASETGRKIASKIAYDLTQNDILVVSGMARGIDSAAHKGALYAKNEQGSTIAVLGTGVDVPYPSENSELYKKICTQGVVISEYPLGTQPQAPNFPRRNRLVSALGSAVLVIEASENSGSLITARSALEQGREIFAVPGSPLDGRSSGANQLIREGAYLTESAEDIIQNLNFSEQRKIKDYIRPDLFSTPLDKPQKNADIRNKSDSSKRSALTDLISGEGTDIDDLIRKSKLSVQEAMMQITELELEERVKRDGSRIFLIK